MARSIQLKVFGLTQGVLLIVFVTTMIIAIRRHRERSRPIEYNFDNVDLRSAIKRTELVRASRPRELTSAFPNWTASTPAHEILAVHPGASSAEVEAAYRELLKRYHPDRFEHWGRGYQNRAHHVIILVQKARDTLLAKNGKR